MRQDKKLKVLFLCTGNSCRSQMAEGWARHLKGDLLEPYSAGIEMHGLNPLAVKVMAEAGVDISGHRSKPVREVMNIPFDYVVTLCDNASETCPVFPGKANRFHISFDDPPTLAELIPDEKGKLDCYRRVRDQIKDFILTLPNSLYSIKDPPMTKQESNQKPAQEPCCGPDCGCNAKPAESKGKKVFLGIVLLAVCAILVYKFAFQAQASTTMENDRFNMAGKLASTQANSPVNPASSAIEMLASMNALNEKALDKAAVMVWVPSKTVNSISGSALSAIQAAQQTIQSKGVKMGLYQLQAGSPDQTNMSGQLPLPAVLVLSKGKGMGTVTGDITTEKLLQAYVASSRAGGCGASSSCAPGSPSCKPAQ